MKTLVKFSDYKYSLYGILTVLAMLLIQDVFLQKSWSLIFQELSFTFVFSSLLCFAIYAGVTWKIKNEKK